MRRIRLYYKNGNSKVYLHTFGDGTNVTDALHESMEWCKANCEERGVMEYYYNGHKILAEQVV
jgi:bisphosphoglycerate-independent phosphoglycerate mutase (AlkP superfamily)